MEESGTLLDELENIFSSSLVAGSIRTPTLVTVTVDRKDFLANLSKLKQVAETKLTGMVVVPGNFQTKEIKYFFNIHFKHDVEILTVLSVTVDENEETESIKSIFPAGNFFENELEAYGVRFRDLEEKWKEIEPEKATMENTVE